jgi:hypothetical protein
MPIPTGTAAISFSQLRDEMNAGSGGAYPATPGTFNLNDATFRSRLTDTTPGTSISLSSLRGNAYQRFTIAANTTDYNIYSAMSAAPIGWNTTSKGSADVVINANIVVGTPSTGTYAMDTGTGWPGTSTIVVYNSGYVVGMGGAGGNGGPSPSPSSSTAGAAGGPGLRAQRAMTLVNSGTVGGGGGGGGGGNGRAYTAPIGANPAVPFGNGGGGGGGGRTSNSPSAGGARGTGGGANPTNGQVGVPGTFAGFGAGGNGGGGGPLNAYPGGDGGGWGTVGSPAPTGKAGGAAGVAVQGWTAFVTAPTGTTGISGPTAG